MLVHENFVKDNGTAVLSTSQFERQSSLGFLLVCNFSVEFFSKVVYPMLVKLLLVTIL